QRRAHLADPVGMGWVHTHKHRAPAESGSGVDGEARRKPIAAGCGEPEGAIPASGVLDYLDARELGVAERAGHAAASSHGEAARIYGATRLVQAGRAALVQLEVGGCHLRYAEGAVGGVDIRERRAAA